MQRVKDKYGHGSAAVNGADNELSDLLTIVIPVKNEEKNLSACLENVEDFASVILVDSGSTDNTRKIFKGKREEGRGMDGRSSISGGMESFRRSGTGC